jgi:hypothetical protein
MGENVVFVDFGLGTGRADVASASGSARAAAADRGNGAQALLDDATRAQQSARRMDAEATTLTTRANAMADSAKRLRAAMADLDRAHDQLEALSTKARDIASFRI